MKNISRKITNKENLKINWAFPLPKSGHGKKPLYLYQYGLLVLSINARMRRHEEVKSIHKNESGKRRENPYNYIIDSINKCELSKFPPLKKIPEKYINY